MIGMFHDGGKDTRILRNVAAGSERAGFSGPGTDCGNREIFRGNEAHSSLAGFWFDFYAVGTNLRSCLSVSNFTAWKIFEYAVYGELVAGNRIEVSELAISDAVIGVELKVLGGDAIQHVLLNKTAVITNSLFVGFSLNGNCPKIPQLLHTCVFYMAYCKHLSIATFINIPQNESQVMISTQHFISPPRPYQAFIFAGHRMENCRNSAHRVPLLRERGSACPLPDPHHWLHLVYESLVHVSLRANAMCDVCLNCQRFCGVRILG